MLDGPQTRRSGIPRRARTPTASLEVEFTNWTTNGIRVLNKSYLDFAVWGFDTETFAGPPISVQLWSGPDDYDMCEAFNVTKHTALTKTLKFFERMPYETHHAVFAHNLKFDLTSLFYKDEHQRELIEINGFDFNVDDWHITGVYGHPTFATMRNRRKRITLYFVDAALWFPGTLDRAAELVCPHLRKLKMPKGLGKKNFNINKDDEFREYAIRDAEISYYQGCEIRDLHQEFDVPLCSTLAWQTAWIFRKHFLSRRIVQPQVAGIKASQLTYHGGKNHIQPGAQLRYHEDVVGLDISSAYPYAMSLMPSFTNPKLFKTSYKNYKKKFPEYGVFCVTGEAEACMWPALFDVNFKPIVGEFNSVWLHSHELNTAIEHGEVRIDSVLMGYWYDAQQDGRESAFEKFVMHFYELKQTAPNEVKRMMYKTILNSLYGKFIQTTEKLDDFGERYLEAGAMYHPFIASSITAHTRAYMHKVEHEFQTIHTATDGVFAPNQRGLKKRVEQFNKDLKLKTQLGELELESRGDLMLVRNKLYILYGDTGQESSLFMDRKIKKAALHGYRGNAHQLEQMMKTGNRTYAKETVNQLKESLKSNGKKKVNNFELREFQINVEPFRDVERLQ